MKIHPVGAEFSMQKNEWTDKHDKANSRYRNFMKVPKKWASTQ